MTDEREVLAELHRIRERLEIAENAFDAAPLVDLLADDAALMVPDFPVQEGRAACREFIDDVTGWQKENLRRHIAYVSAEVKVLGDHAFDRGTFAFTVALLSGGDDEQVTGKYFWLYARLDGSWQLSRMMMAVDEGDDDDHDHD